MGMIDLAAIFLKPVVEIALAQAASGGAQQDTQTGGRVACSERLDEYLNNCSTIFSGATTDDVDKVTIDALEAEADKGARDAIKDKCAKDPENKTTTCAKAYWSGMAAYWRDAKKSCLERANLADPEYYDKEMNYLSGKTIASDAVKDPEKYEGCKTPPVVNEEEVNWCDVTPAMSKDRTVRAANDRCANLCKAEFKKSGLTDPKQQSMPELVDKTKRYDLPWKVEEVNSTCVRGTDENGEEFGKTGQTLLELGFAASFNNNGGVRIDQVCSAKQISALNVLYGKIEEQLAAAQKELARFAPRQSSGSGSGSEYLPEVEFE